MYDEIIALGTLGAAIAAAGGLILIFIQMRKNGKINSNNEKIQRTEFYLKLEERF